jgi:hypothetical protein
MPKNFKELSDREVLALAIQLEGEDARIYGDFADGLRQTYPVTAKAFKEMQAEEVYHRQRLIERFQAQFGDHIPLIWRSDVKGFLDRKSYGWSARWESKRFKNNSNRWNSNHADSA